ncbi:SgcJ/EcaC family oxidoreductase [Archangium lipolyticum]|uniref:SgcJ/EcaC family oxidoreductase n=1 Tax=Archangium lipolyticum TaxID=2970465 RepID=UPI00214A069E|nr:SgcJ/EcaC family oxidoreductase [Archangium lipolyticum]
MKAFFHLMTTAAVALTFVLVPPATAESAKARGADEAAIRKLVADQTEAWNRSDAAAWSKDFAPDAEFINIVGTVFKGRAEIETRHAFVFDKLFKGSRTQVTVTGVRFLGGDVAVTDMEHVVTGYAGLPPGVQPTEAGVLKTRMRYVMKKNGKRWEIVAGQNTDVKPTPAPGTSRPQGTPAGQ